VRELLELTYERRSTDLSDLSPTEQAALIAERCEQLQPSLEALAKRLAEPGKRGRPFIAKLGIDPTGSEVHLGHAVPMLLLSRFQRMGHHVVLIIGDMTAMIGDPSGRSDERPHLTQEDIARNLATYQEQVSPFFDFSRAEFRRNGDCLAAGHSLTLAELLYSVAMALDSVEINCDLELGGLDQFLNMQMCRKVMEICGQEPELVVATTLLEGTDGTGAKMSKSRGNYVPLNAPPGEVFGKLMVPYLKALSEWQGPELLLVERRLVDGSLHPVDLKKILAGEVTASLHGVDAAMKAREEFAAQFSRHSYAEVEDVPTVEDLSQPIVEVVRSLGFASSNGEVRRIAEQNGLRLVVEPPNGAPQLQATLKPEDLREPLADLMEAKLDGIAGDWYLRVGRKLARIINLV
jgi:tyrosyl-tRNA synthetase